MGTAFASEHFCASDLQNERVHYCLFQQYVAQRHTENYEAVKLHFKAAQKMGEASSTLKSNERQRRTCNNNCLQLDG
jgi:hypothetical protein